MRRMVCRGIHAVNRDCSDTTHWLSLTCLGSGHTMLRMIGRTISYYRIVEKLGGRGE
jgi:hypothetical protein